MAWIPLLPELGTYLELVVVNHSITYFGEPDPITLIEIQYPVTITSLQIDPNTLNKSSGMTATITGHYFDAFDNTLIYRTVDGNFNTHVKFDDINRSDLHEMISYSADTNRTKTYSYRADAIDPVTNAVIATQTYDTIVENNWDIGKNNLQTYVGYTQ